MYPVPVHSCSGIQPYGFRLPVADWQKGVISRAGNEFDNIFEYIGTLSCGLSYNRVISLENPFLLLLFT